MGGRAVGKQLGARERECRWPVAVLGATLALLGATPAAHGADDGSEQTASAVTLRGFGTLGGVRTDTDQARFLRDLSQPSGTGTDWSAKNDSALGLQLNWTASPDVEVVGQAVSHYQYDGSFSPDLSLAFVKWNPGPRASLRFGRIGADFLMLSDSRLIGYSYLPVRPSLDYFGQLFFSYLDGGDVRVVLPSGDGIVTAKAFLGRVGEKAPYSLGLWDTAGSTVGGTILNYQEGPWMLRGSVAKIRFSHDHGFAGLADALRTVGNTYGFPSALTAADEISAEGTISSYYSAGLVYDDGPLLLQGMVNHIDHQSGVFQNSSAAYVLAGYRVGTLTPYLGVSRVKSSYKANSTGLPSGVGFDALIAGYDHLMAATTMNQTTWRLGARWDFRANMALKVQLDAIRGTPDSRFLVWNPTADWNGNLNVFSVSLDFVF